MLTEKGPRSVVYFVGPPNANHMESQARGRSAAHCLSPPPFQGVLGKNVLDPQACTFERADDHPALSAASGGVQFLIVLKDYLQAFADPCVWNDCYILQSNPRPRQPIIEIK